MSTIFAKKCLAKKPKVNSHHGRRWMGSKYQSEFTYAMDTEVVEFVLPQFFYFGSNGSRFTIVSCIVWHAVW